MKLSVHKKFSSRVCNIRSLNSIFIMNNDAYRPGKLSPIICVCVGGWSAVGAKYCMIVSQQEVAHKYCQLK